MVGLGFVVAAPVRLWEEARGHQVAWIRSPLLHVLGFPVVSATANGVLIVAAFNSSWFARSRSDDGSWIALIGACLLGGFLANLQLLSAGSGAWLDDPGLADGPFVRRWSVGRTSRDRCDGHGEPGLGGILWGAAQPVVVPMIILILIDWIRHDRKMGRDVDSALDSIEAAGGNISTPWWITGRSGGELDPGEPGAAPHRPGD